MYNIDGWIHLIDVDLYVPGENWRLTQERETEKLKLWKNRVASHEHSEVRVGIRSLNGDDVLTVHSVRPVNFRQMKEIKSLIFEITEAFCESSGLVYLKGISQNTDIANFVIAVSKSEVSVRHDPFLTDVNM